MNGYPNVRRWYAYPACFPSFQYSSFARYSPALMAGSRNWDPSPASYASSSASATNVVQTRLGAKRGTSSRRVCHGKLYPQDQ